LTLVDALKVATKSSAYVTSALVLRELYAMQGKPWDWNQFDRQFFDALAEMTKIFARRSHRLSETDDPDRGAPLASTP
jgi:hypothetical protein